MLSSRYSPAQIVANTAAILWKWVASAFGASALIALAVMAAIWFGVRGGVGTALAITLLTLPYPKVRGITDPHAVIGEYTEMVFYFAIGLMTGVLIERQWRERERSAALQSELARSERLSSLGQMAAGLAHEIRNPLGSIQGAAEMLSDDAPAGSRQHHGLDTRRATGATTLGASREYIVVTAVGARRLGLIVATLVGEQDVVIKALGPSLKSVRGFAGATELGDQRIALVIDAPALIEETQVVGERSRSEGLRGTHG